jgi:hypothetical protein
MKIAMNDLELDALYVITPKAESYKLGPKISCYGLKDFFDLAKQLFSL